MNLSPGIDLSRSLRQVFGNKAEYNKQIEQDCARQTMTAKAILKRFFTGIEAEKREMSILPTRLASGRHTLRWP
jgi:hypothetical protein